MNRGIKIARTIFPPKSIRKIESLKYIYQKKAKIVVFVPPDIADRITTSMARGGAGKIGGYTECSYRANGEGTFRGGKKTDPFVGKRGRLEKVTEQRLEMVCSFDNLDSVIDAMLEIHPYEEPAYEVYEVWIRKKIRKSDSIKVELKSPVELAKILDCINPRIDGSDDLDMLAGTKIRRAVISFRERQEGLAFLPAANETALYLAMSKNNSYTIKLK